MESPFTIKPYTQKELCIYYRCCDRTFKKWLLLFENEIGPKVGNLYTPKQVKVIVERLGAP